MDTNDIKQRFNLVGNDPKIDQAIDTAVQIAPIQLSVLIIGESGSGKEAFPQIIHSYSRRKHKPYVAVNCGAIPEGTIDSELFGHVKGSFTGAVAERKGYFEEANGGTIFLDEIGELPLATQAKLLRVLEKGEYMRVGSSVVQKTDVRIVAATNIDLEQAIGRGKFREDLFYRLNGVMIRIPPLRERKGDIASLFRKFTSDFADQNQMPPVRLLPEAAELLSNYAWPGNVRQLKNVANQVTALAQSREVDADELMRFMPHQGMQQPAFGGSLLPQIEGQAQETFNSEREILYKILFDMRKDVSDLKKLVVEMINNGQISQENAQIVKRLYQSNREGELLDYEIQTLESKQHAHLSPASADDPDEQYLHVAKVHDIGDVQDVSETEEGETLSIPHNERELIRKALKKWEGHRKYAAEDLGISERTLYRKINDYNIEI